MSAPLPTSEKNALLLSVAAVICAVFWAWACVRAVLIDALLPEDSRAALALVPCYPALLMTAVFLLRIARIVSHPRSGAVAWHRSSVMIAATLNAVAIFCLVVSAFIAPWALALFLPFLLLFPPGLIGIALALVSIRRDLPRQARATA